MLPGASQTNAPRSVRLLEDIERELKRHYWWQEMPLASEKFVNMGPFGGNTVIFEPWLQFVFLPAVKDTLTGRRQAPNSSSVGTYALRNFDGNPDRDTLVQLSRFASASWSATEPDSAYARRALHPHPKLPASQRAPPH